MLLKEELELFLSRAQKRGAAVEEGTRSRSRHQEGLQIPGSLSPRRAVAKAWLGPAWPSAPRVARRNR